MMMMKTWTQSEFCTWQNSVRGQEPRICIYGVPADSQTSCKVSLTSVERRRCSNEAKTRNRLKFAGCPKLANRSQQLVRRSSLYYEDTWRRYCRLTSFFLIVDTCLSCEDIAPQSCAIVRKWRLLRHFCVLYFQQAAYSTFQTCILNWH